VTPACGGDDEDGITYEGKPGMPIESEFTADIPTVTVVLNGGEPKTYLADTGAPLTIVNAPSYPGRAEGKAQDEVETFGLLFPGFQTATWAIFDPLSGIDGIVGGDLLRHFAFSVDYRGGRVWLSDPFDEATIPSDLELEPALDVPFDLLGGGRAALPGCGGSCGVVDLAATRVILQAVFEDDEPVWVLVDSGASAIVLDAGYFATLAEDPDRPRLDGVTVGTVTGNVDAFLTRVWQVTLQGRDGGAIRSATEDDIPVLVLPTSGLIESLSMEVDRDIKALIGGSILRHYLTTFDYQTRELRLARYSNEDHIAANEYVSVGFSLLPFGDEWIVGDVYDGTDADLDGLIEGDVVEELAGQQITGQPEQYVGGLFAGYRLGDEVPVGVRAPGGVVTHMILVEDLLPSYVMP
jgi:hypothetical protein